MSKPKSHNPHKPDNNKSDNPANNPAPTVNILESICVQYEHARATQGAARTPADIEDSTNRLRRWERSLICEIYRASVVTGRRLHDSAETGYRYAVDACGELERLAVIAEPKSVAAKDKAKLSEVAKDRRKRWKLADSRR